MAINLNLKCFSELMPGVAEPRGGFGMVCVKRAK